MSWWDDITPWDTINERKQDRKKEIKKVQKEIRKAYENIAPPPEPVDDDGDGRPDRLINPETGETLQDYTRINDMLDQAQQQGQNLPSFDQWMADTGRTFNDIQTSSPWQGMDALIQQMEAGPTAGEWDDAYAHAARLMGITPEEYQEIVGGLSRELEAGVSGQQGMGDAELAMRERDMRAQTRYATERAERMIENIRANSGSATRAYMAADQALRQINDYELQQQVALADEQYRRQMADFEAKERHWAQMVERGQMGVEQYMNVLERNRAQAFQGYATQMNALFQENAQYLQMHQQELGRLQQHVENMYMAVNAEMGVASHVMQQIQDYYGLELAQFQAKMAAVTSEFQLEAMEWAVEDQARAQRVGNIFGGLMIAGGVALSFADPGAGLTLAGSGFSTIAGGYGANVPVPNFADFDFSFDNNKSSSESGGTDNSYSQAQQSPYTV